MRRVIFALVLLCLSACAFAEIHESRYYSVEVPEGWNVHEQGQRVTITANDGSASLTILADNLKGESLDRVAANFALELGASYMDIDSDDSYSFEFSDGKSQAMISGSDDDDFYMLITCRGLEQSGDMLMKILGSLEMK